MYCKLHVNHVTAITAPISDLSQQSKLTTLSAPRYHNKKLNVQMFCAVCLLSTLYTRGSKYPHRQLVHYLYWTGVFGPTNSNLKKKHSMDTGHCVSSNNI